MKNYKVPELTKCLFDSEDIIMTSQNTSADAVSNLGEQLVNEGYTFQGQGSTTTIQTGAYFFID